MRKFLTLTAAAAVVAAFGFGGAAQAFDILTIGTQDNSNAEFGVSPAAGATADLGPYNYDADLNNFGSANKTSPNNGFPDIQAGPDEPAAGGVQPDDFNPLNVNFTLGCVLLPGTQGNLLVDLFQVRISNGGGAAPDDFAFNVTFNGGTQISTTFNVTSDGNVNAGTSGTTELNNFAVNQTDLFVGSNTIEVDVTDGQSMKYDFVKLTGDCVKDFAKISGGIRGQGSRGGGGGKGSPTHAFGGAVGTEDTGGMDPTGELTINYRTAFGSPATCTFTPNGGTLAIVGDTATLTGWDYTCVGGSTVSGEAIIVLVGTDGVGGPGKDRGSICVDADDAALDIGGTDSLCDESGDQVDLDRGNVIVDDDVTS